MNLKLLSYAVYVTQTVISVLATSSFSLTHNHQAVLASCNADTDLVSVCYEAQVAPQPPNISLLLLHPTNCDVF